MIYAHEVQQCGMEIMYMYRIFYNVITKFVSLTIAKAFLHSTACHPDAETPRMMISTVIVGPEPALAIVGSAKLPAPDYEGIVEHTALFKIQHEGSRCLVHIQCLL